MQLGPAYTAESLFCGECVVEVKGKLYCKPDLGNVVDELEEKGNQAAPTVFMNAGGGGGGSSSSAAAASSGAGAGVLVPTKSKGLAGLLALFLGGFGIHKFYLGRTGMGILYLLLCWTFVPAIVALVEAIRLFTMSEDAFALKYGGRRV